MKRTMMVEARQLLKKRTPQSRQGAIKKYEEALELWKAAGDLRGQAQTLNNLGRLRAETPKGLDYYNEALSLARSINDRGLEIIILNGIGASHSVRGDRQTAADYYNQALSLCRATGDRWREAVTLNQLSLEYQF